MDRIVITLLLTALAASCARSAGTQDVQGQQQENVQAESRFKMGVSTIDVSTVAGKGRIWSLNTVPIYSVVDGIIDRMSLVEGQRVRKNDVLAVIDDSECRLLLSELESELQKKACEVRSSLIGMGYSRDNLDSVPAEERESVEIMTGYTCTKVKYGNLKQMLEKHIIRAPFNGSILDIKVSRLFYARKGEPLFYLMDTDDLVVQFEVLETMVSRYSVGMPM